MVEPVALGDRARELLRVIECCSSSTLSGGMPDARASLTALSTRSRSQKPSSTSTSVRNRLEPPLRVGAVTPSQSSRCSASALESA